MTIAGEFDTIMAGLAAGEVSEYAWPVLRSAADFSMTISDDAAIDTMRTIAQREPRVIAGESGVAGLAGALLLAQNEEAREKVGLNADSRVLTIGTEGATDAGIYTQLVGTPPDELGAAS